MNISLKRIVQNVRLPSLCILCHQYYQGKNTICPACIAHFPKIGPCCHHCACPLPSSTFLTCGKCTIEKPFINRIHVLYAYKEPLRNILHEFKYHSGIYLTSQMADLMVKEIPEELLSTQCFIPVPLHIKRLRERGYNQAALLAKALSRRFNIPCDVFSCTKIKHTIPQAQLNGKERQINFKNAFLVKKIPFKHVTIIDDLLTTSSTGNELAHTLKKSGVTRVDLWCCARTI